MKAKRVFSILIILPTIFLSGCWSSREINTLAITICIGIDKTKDGYLVSEQVLNPKAIASKKPTNESPVILYTEEGKDIEQIIKKFTTQASRRLYKAHLRMVVFGEDVARDGIQGMLDYFARDHEYRTDFYFVVAKGTTARNVLSILTPIESIPGIEMYNSLKTSEAEWAPTKSIRIVELVNSIIADGNNPVLSGVEITSGIVNSDSTDALKQTNKIKKVKYTCLGVLKKDKLVGWLNEDEAKGYNYIKGNIKRTVGYTYYDNSVKITGQVSNAKSSVKASLINSKPVINVQISFIYSIEAVKGDFDVSKEENKQILNSLAEKDVLLLCEKAVNKAQKELKSDVFGFGEVIHRSYPKLWSKIKENWNNEFTDIQVNISVKAKINQLGEVTKPFFITH